MAKKCEAWRPAGPAPTASRARRRPVAMRAEWRCAAAAVRRGRRKQVAAARQRGDAALARAGTRSASAWRRPQCAPEARKVLLADVPAGEHRHEDEHERKPVRKARATAVTASAQPPTTAPATTRVSGKRCIR